MTSHARAMRALLSLVVFLAHSERSTALRVAFLADTGIGNSKPGSVWTDFRGNARTPSYKVDGVECTKYDSSYCGEFSRAKDVFRLAREAKADVIVHAGDLDYVSSPESWLRFLTEHAFSTRRWVRRHERESRRRRMGRRRKSLVGSPRISSSSLATDSAKGEDVWRTAKIFP